MATGPLNVIASDGGFLGATVQADTLFMSPGERYEILVDMRQVDINQLIVTHGLPELGGIKGIMRELLSDG